DASGQLDKAIIHYKKALDIQPDYAEALNDLGTALAERGQYDAAIRHFQKALAIEPQFIKARKNLNLVLVLQKQAQKTLAEQRERIRTARAHDRREWRRRVGCGHRVQITGEQCAAGAGLTAHEQR
ncbi:MAG: tetratricopeptide repeat protein, partial [Proteobacteria bacterium]|nr:tetratricopeptide repeat protein [Pseudomonadota bacterium]